LTGFLPPLELFSLEEEAAQLPGGLFVSVHGGGSRGINLVRRMRGTVVQQSSYCFVTGFFWFSVFSPGANMFCDGCGSEVQAGQAFCSKCGKQIVGIVAPAQRARNRVQRHVHLLGILWLALSAINGVGGVLVVIVANTLIPHLHDFGAPKDVPIEFFTAILNVVGVLILAKSACGFLAGWGLLHRESWARVLTLVLGFVALIHVPFGTALGVYTLWVLLPTESQTEYETIAVAQPA
jgi:hypothetical protein